MSQGSERGAGGSRSMQLMRRFESVAVPTVEHEDRLPLEEATDVWEDIFRLFRANSEQVRDEVKVAVYAYYAVNGTAAMGKHSRSLTVGSETVPANAVKNVIPGEKYREFLRADVIEAYWALKAGNVLEEDDVWVQKCKDKGVPRGFTHCAVDYLRGCPEFTNEEKVYVDLAFKVSIARANAARGGKSVEEISEREKMARVEAGTYGNQRAAVSVEQF